MFIWPTNTKRITSNFGYRIHPITGQRGKLHPGIDIAESGTHPVYAAANGTVTRSYRSATYGECIFILHNISYQTYETVYAHMKTGSRKVKVGDKVKQGQTIGTMGNTGNSTGQHLHFEIHRGRWNLSKTNAVNPLNYLKVSNYLSKGDKGAEVKKLQQNLIKLGYKTGKSGADGEFGEGTDKAVRAFQKDNNLIADGRVGKMTKDEIKRILNGGLTMNQYEELKKIINNQNKKITSLEKKLNKKQNKPQSNDTPDPSHAKQWKWATENGLFNGKRPHEFITREQNATVLKRYYDLNKSE